MEGKVHWEGLFSFHSFVLKKNLKILNRGLAVPTDGTMARLDTPLILLFISI